MALLFLCFKETQLSDTASNVNRLNNEKTELEKSLKEAVEEKTTTSAELRDIQLKLSGTISYNLYQWFPNFAQCKFFDKLML